MEVCVFLWLSVVGIAGTLIGGAAGFVAGYLVALDRLHAEGDWDPLQPPEP